MRDKDQGHHIEDQETKLGQEKKGILDSGQGKGRDQESHGSQDLLKRGN